MTFHLTLLLASGLLATEAGLPGPEAPGRLPGALPDDPGGVSVSLSDAVALALEGNFGLRSLADTVVSARYAESAARARFLPSVTPSYQASADAKAFALQASQEVPWTGGSLAASAILRQDDPGDLHTSDLRLSYTQPLLRGFGPTVTRFGVRNSERVRESQERSFELARQRLAVDVAQAFYQVARQRLLLEVAESSLQRSLELAEASEQRMAVGLASRLDVLRAELQAEQARDAALSARTSLESALEQFRSLLGLPPSARVEPEPLTLVENPGLSLPSLDVLVSAAFANRLELREAGDRIGDARRALAVARNSLLPQLDVNVAVTRASMGDRFPALAGGDRRVEVFLTTSYPVQRSADRAQAAIARLDLARTERDRRERELSLESEVRAAVRDLQRIHASIQVQRKRTTVAHEQQRLATLRYQRGVASNFDVVDAEASIVSARTALAGLLADFQVARLRLLRTTGELDVDEDFR